MKVWLDGQGPVVLGSREFVGRGGQGEVYARGKVAYKVFSDPFAVMPEGKFSELGQIRDPQVVRPQRLLRNKDGKPVGYTMAFVENAYALCSLYPKSFRLRTGLNHDLALKLCTRMRATLQAIHAADVLVVDLNSMNVLVSSDLGTPYFIDCDSFQTKSYSATAIMDSVRDRSAPHGVFSMDTDWFSFAIITYQLLTGIHPYKGTHPTLRGLDARMKARVSVFSSDVRVPGVVYPPDVIPDKLRAWYRDVFEADERCPPPIAGAARSYVPRATPVKGRGQLVPTQIGDFASPVLGAYYSRGHACVSTRDALWVDGHSHGPAGGVVFSAREGRPISFARQGKGVALRDLVGRQDIAFQVLVDELSESGGRLYIRTGDSISELMLERVGERVVASLRCTAKVLPHATALFPGVAFQNLLGATYASLFPSSGVTYQRHLEELDGTIIVNAEFDSGVLQVAAESRNPKQSRTDRYVFRFSRDYSDYDLRMEEDVSTAELNFVTLDTGICVSGTDRDTLEVFRSTPGNPQLRELRDPLLAGELLLSKRANTLLFSRGTGVFSLSMA